MDPTTIVAVSELAKLGLVVYLTYMRQAGLSDEQIDKIYNDAKAGMLIRDPSKIPSA